MNYISADKIFYHPKKIAQDGFTPITAEVFLTNKCNNSCYYCSQKHKSDNHVKPAEIDFPTTVKVFDFLEDLGVKSVVFSGGGEPTLHDKLMAVIRAYSCFDFGIITNGVVIPEDFKNYVSIPKWIRVSIDTADAETYKKIRGTDNFNRVVENVKFLLKLKKENNFNTVIGLHVVVNKYNYDKLIEIAEFVLSEFPDINYLQIRAMEKYVNDEIYTINEWREIEKRVEYLKMRCYENKIMLSNKWEMVKLNKFGFTKCEASKYMLNISAEGNISTCCHMSDNPLYKICNINDFNTVDEFRQIHADKINSWNDKGFNPEFCPIACRGFGINRSIESFKTREHVNFI